MIAQIMGQIIAFVCAYGLGSIPFGLLLTRLAGLGDIRSIGSGNIGATNVLRTGHKKLAAATLLLDGGKGVVAVLALMPLNSSFGGLALNEVAAAGAMMGHVFSVWLGFKGGKGVATGIGVMLGLYWPAGLVMIVAWLVMAKFFKISSLSALTAFATAPLAVLWLGRSDLVLLAVGIAALIFYTHRENIKRLLNHTEPKIGQKNAPNSAPDPV